MNPRKQAWQRIYEPRLINNGVDVTYCEKNPQTAFFGLFTFRGPHDLDYLHADISTWGHRSWNNWEFTAPCKLCGRTIHDFGLTRDELARRGLLDIMDKKGIDYSWRSINDF